MTEEEKTREQETASAGQVGETETLRAIPDTDFMREQIKQRPVNRRRLLRRTLITVLLAVVFGVVATFTFILLEPALNRALNPETEPAPDPVVLVEPPAEEEVPPEALIREESEMLHEGEPTDVEEVLNRYTFDGTDYSEMVQSMKETAVNASKSLVTITGLSSETGWSGDALLTSDTTSGLILSDNGYSLIILTDRESVRDAEQLRVTFSDGTVAEGTYLSGDESTSLAVITVPLNALTPEQRQNMPPATLGRSTVNTLIGQPVIAIGEPAGIAGSIMYGAVVTNARSLTFPDFNIQLLSTDIVSQANANGVLINLRGEVIGFCTPHLSRLSQEDAPLQLHYAGISAIRSLAEHLSNGRTRAFLGVYGTDVPAELRENEDIPQGAFVNRIELNSPAMTAGIQSGDIITKIDNTDIVNYTMLFQELLTHTPEDSVSVTLMRPSAEGFTEVTTDVILGTAEPEA